MSERLTILVREEDSKVLRWVQKAQSKDDVRPVFCGVYVKDGNVAATDGHRIHVSKAPMDRQKIEGKIIKGKVPAGETFVTMQEIIGIYPDLSMFAKDEPPVFSISLNAKYLEQAVSGMNGNVRLVFWGSKQPMELFGESKDAVPCHATIMPIHIDAKSSKAWRPFGGSLKD